MIYPDCADQWITEDTIPDRYPMAESNLAAESSATRFTEQGGRGIVLRFGWFYGPGATHAEELFALAKRHVCVQMGKPSGYVSSIHVQDAGRAVAAALDAPAGTYNVVDDEPLTKADYAQALADATETRCWIHLPGRAALLLGHRTTSLTRSLRVSHERFRAHTTWKPDFPSAREGWADTARNLTESTAAVRLTVVDVALALVLLGAKPRPAWPSLQGSPAPATRTEIKVVTSEPPSHHAHVIHKTLNRCAATRLGAMAPRICGGWPVMATNLKNRSDGHQHHGTRPCS